MNPQVVVKGLEWPGAKDPTFIQGETHTAKATLTNKTNQALTCTTELYLDVTKVASSGVSSSFTLPAGGSIDVSYVITMSKVGGPWHVYIDVWSGTTLLIHYQATEDVTVKIAGLLLHFSNPQKSATLWDAWALDIATGNYISAEPSGIKEIAVAKALKPTTTTFLLWVQEFNPAIPGPYNFGPYLVTIPKFGEYTWNSAAGKIDETLCPNLPLTNNRSLVTGYMTFTPASTYTVATVSIKPLEKADDVSGYRNVAKYFIGKTINVEFADDVPYSPVYGTVPAQKATGYIQLRRTSDNYREEWYGYGWRALKTYPPEAYKFSGSLQLLKPGGTLYGMQTYGQVQYSISGNVSPFAVAINVPNPLTGEPGVYDLQGPTSGILNMPIFGYDSWGNPIYVCAYARMYAHPDPTAKWDRYFWQFYNWQQVG